MRIRDVGPEHVDVHRDELDTLANGVFASYSTTVLVGKTGQISWICCPETTESRSHRTSTRCRTGIWRRRGNLVRSASDGEGTTGGRVIGVMRLEHRRAGRSPSAEVSTARPYRRFGIPGCFVVTPKTLLAARRIPWTCSARRSPRTSSFRGALRRDRAAGSSVARRRL